LHYFHHVLAKARPIQSVRASMAFVSGIPTQLRSSKGFRRRCSRDWQRVTQCLVSPTSPRTLKPLASFIDWASTNKADLSGLALSQLSDDLRGVVTAKSRVVGDQLVSVPASLALQVTSLESKRSPFPDLVSHDAWARAPWYAKLAVRLLHAKLGGEAEHHFPWISALPQTFQEFPFHWSESELAELQNKRMVLAVHAQRKAYSKLYDSLFPGKTRKVSFDDFLWGLHCVRSRCFAGELETAPFKERTRLFGLIGALAVASSTLGFLPAADAANGALTSLVALGMYDVLTPRILEAMQGVRLKRYALIPGIDFINHSSRVNGKAEVSYEYFTDRFVVRCGEEYASGEEVSISYGAQSNDSFLQYYGFVEEDNPADEFIFDEEYERMMNVGKGTLRARRHVGFDATVIEEVASRFGGDKDAARKSLAELCRAVLASLPTSLAEDSAIRAQSRKEQLSLSYRMAKKRILASVVESMELPEVLVATEGP
jgi:hypothetical protein